MGHALSKAENATVFTVHQEVVQLPRKDSEAIKYIQLHFFQSKGLLCGQPTAYLRHYAFTGLNLQANKRKLS